MSEALRQHSAACKLPHQLLLESMNVLDVNHKKQKAMLVKLDISVQRHPHSC